MCLYEEIPPYYVKRFECLEKRYINVTNYYYYYCMLSAGEINSYRDEIETQLAASSRPKLRGIYASYAREGRSNQVLCLFV